MPICYNIVCSPAALSHELQQLLGPVTYCAEHGVALTKSPLLGSPIKVSHQPIAKDAWYTDGSCKGPLASWRAMVYQPQTDSIWTEDGLSHSSQWADLCTIWIVISQEHRLLTICTNSWAVFCRSTLWLPQWEQQWTIMEKLLQG